jgi:hypothetical protein
MYFQAQLGYIIPGNFVGWRIRPIPGFKTPSIPQNYTVEGAEEALSQIGGSISQRSPFAMPSVRGGDALDSAVFEIEKVGRSKFRVLRYVGVLHVERSVVKK